MADDLNMAALITGYAVWVIAGWLALLGFLTFAVNKTVEWLRIKRDMLEAAERMYKERRNKHREDG